jgi:hypothetical protein
MNVAFITEINLDDLSNLPDVAREIQEDLTNAGFEVVSVAPWKRPSLEQGGTPLFGTNVPTPTTQQQTENLENII